VPERFEIGENYRLSAASRPGTVIVRPAQPRAGGDPQWGPLLLTPSPCCPETSKQVEVGTILRYGPTSARCRGCGWQWRIALAAREDAPGGYVAEWETVGPPPGRNWRKGRTFPKGT
jgi:hypothetical protein